ncbi:MAG TPA: ubiquitin-like protein, partial [Candidatus Obscuribacterales bacterium]
MIIYVLTPTGKRILLRDISPRTTIDEVKQRIQTLEGIPPERQSLSYDEQALQNDRTLTSYGIGDGQTLSITDNNDLIQITIVTPSGREVQLTALTPTTTIDTVKQRIQTLEGIRPERQRLVSNGQDLLNRRTLTSYG